MIRADCLDDPIANYPTNSIMFLKFATKRWAALSLSLSTVLGAGWGLASAPAIALPYVVENRHSLNNGTYLGGTGHDEARGMVFARNGDPIVAGNFATLQTMGAVRLVRPGALQSQAGKVMRMTFAGQVAVELTLGNRIDDMDITPAGNRLVVTGDFGVAVLDPNSLRLLWHNPLTGLGAGNGSPDGGQTRVAIDESWRVVVLRSGTLQTFDPAGKPLATRFIDRTFVNDVAMDHARNQVYVLGYSNRKNNGVPVQVPFVYGLNANTLQENWRTWDFDPALLKTTTTDNMADSRMYRIALHPTTGEPVVLGESAGGNSPFRWNGKDLSTNTLIKYDPYSDTYNSKSNHMVYYAKLNPTNGVVNAGQYVTARLDFNIPIDNARTNTTRAQNGSIAVDSRGNIYIGHISAYRIAERDTNIVAGQPVAPYTGADFNILMVTPDMKQRTKWVTFAANPSGGGTPNAIAFKDNRIGIFGTVDFGGLITLPNAIAPKPFNPENDAVKDAYLAVMRVY